MESIPRDPFSFPCPFSPSDRSRLAPFLPPVVHSSLSVRRDQHSGSSNLVYFVSCRVGNPNAFPGSPAPGRCKVPVCSRALCSMPYQVAEKLLDRSSPRIDMRGRPEPGRSVPPEADKSARLHSRTMNKVVVVRPACRAVVQRSAGLPPGQRVKRRLQMHLASPTGPAHAEVSSAIMKMSFSATCYVFPPPCPGAEVILYFQGKS
jgi:hypothetical protein